MNWKGWLKSKTFWLNVMAIVVEVGRRLLEVEAIPPLDPVLLALVNLVLRKFTSKPVSGLL